MIIYDFFVFNNLSTVTSVSCFYWCMLKLTTVTFLFAFILFKRNGLAYKFRHYPS